MRWPFDRTEPDEVREAYEQGRRDGDTAGYAEAEDQLRRQLATLIALVRGVVQEIEGEPWKIPDDPWLRRDPS